MLSLSLLTEERIPNLSAGHLFFFPETLTQDNETCYYPGDKRHYRAGTVWHPYIPPNGYSTCVTCTCDVRNF